MEAASVMPLVYSLDEYCPVSWTESAEAHLHHDYPFLNQKDTDGDFVIRRYLETLWLPESFNPLSHLVSSIRRIIPPSGENLSQPHPLHSLLEPLLLSTRAASDKYRTELVQILADGGGAGEQEEIMMWYAWEYEKVDKEEGGDNDDEKWRKAWLERLERRETMIQILLNMLKLSLPSPKLAVPVHENLTKKSKKQSKHELPPETDEERLESYMDKIAVWQLTGSLEGIQTFSQGVGSSQGKAKADRHWTQTFCEDVVEPLFKAKLPEQCGLFRSKVFPELSFSDAEDSDVETMLDGRNSRAGSRAPSVSRVPVSRVPSVAPTGHGLQRSRSRSLSVSLAQDEASQRASFIETKRTLSREVSMSRVFKEKPRARAKPKAPEQPKAAKAKLKRDMGVTLVEETPAKRRCADSVYDEQTWRSWSQQSRMQKEFAAAASSVPSPPPTSSSSPGNVCIEDTPLVMRKRQLERQNTLPSLSPMAVDEPDRSVPAAVKVTKTRGKKTSARLQAPSQSLRSAQLSIFNKETDAELDESADDSYMNSFGSSNVMLLDDSNGRDTMVSPSPAARIRKGGGLGANLRRMPMRMDDAADVLMETPTKGRTRKR